MKKGFVNMIDVVIAVILLVIGILLLLYNMPKSQEKFFFSDMVSNDIIGVLSRTSITEVCENPGLSEAEGCECRHYNQTLSKLVCTDTLQNPKESIMEMLAEVIETGTANQTDIDSVITDMFVTKKIIDEKRFGFSIIYTDPVTKQQHEIYNTICKEDPSKCPT